MYIAGWTLHIHLFLAARSVGEAECKVLRAWQSVCNILWTAEVLFQHSPWSFQPLSLHRHICLYLYNNSHYFLSKLHNPAINMASPQPDIVAIAAQLQTLGAQLQAMSVQETLATQLRETVANPANLEERISAIEADIKNAQSTFNSIQEALDGIKAVLIPLNRDLDRRTAECVALPHQRCQKLIRRRVHNKDAKKYNARANESQKLIRLRDHENNPISGLPNTIMDLYRMPGECPQYDTCKFQR
jgi:biotin-(acetyl-CoA carboxylase) ligase